MNNIIIIGGGGHAKVLICIIKKIKKYNILGYIDFKDNGKILSVPYLGTEELLSQLLDDHKVLCAAIGVGYIKLGNARELIFEKLKNLGFSLPSIISPKSIINEDVQIGEGTVVFDGVVINPGTRIGKGCIINTNSTIEHDCEIGDFVHVAPGVTLSGGLKIGNLTLIGTGAKVIQYLKIADEIIIGAGSLVVRDCLKKGKYMGVPARLKE